MANNKYYQFCPVAKGAELFAERWTPLILRELLLGSTRFNDLRKGLPRISQSLLSQRLKELEDNRLIVRHPAESGRGSEYVLTQAGRELQPVVEQLGLWGRRWAQKKVVPEDLDAGLLMWDMRRRVHLERLPEQRVTVHFHFPDADAHHRRFWMLLERNDVDLCLDDPGYDIDLTVESTVLAMTQVWLGHSTFAREVKAGNIVFEGPAGLRREFPNWVMLSHFA